MAAPSGPRPLTGAILVGGASRRMGADKASVVVEGRTMLERTSATVAAVCDDVMVVAREGQPIPFVTTPVRVVRDRVVGAGPLAGIDAALAAARHDLLLAVPVDMPLLSPDVLRLMVDTLVRNPGADAVALRHGGARQPLPAIYRSRVAEVVTRMLAHDRRRLAELLDELEVAEVDEETWRHLDPEGASMVNVNAPDDVVTPPATQR